MPKEFFKLESVTSILKLAPKSHVHIVGVCGVAMAQIAILLTKRGFKVSGSDKEFYEPMGSLLKKSAVKTFNSFNAENVAEDVSLVVIGNSISYGNPEVEVVEKRGLPYTCFPKLLDEVVIENKKSIVVTGTHGKSTTSAIIASMLFKMNLNPSYFVGGVAEDLPQSLHSDDGKHCVLEGDEYDSAFFAKVPKFSFYHPDICIVNAIEFDHADIYADLAAINREFDKLIASMPKSGIAVCCVDFENVRALVQTWKKSVQCKILTFGESPDSDFTISSRKQSGFSQTIEIESKQHGKFTYTIPLPGVFNARNSLAALITAINLELELEKAKLAISNFKSVKRRQEVRLNKNGVVVVEDFAHHPTAVNETIKAVREGFPGKKLWAVFEPRSATSRRKVFQNDYIKAFSLANEVILCEVTSRNADQGVELLDVTELGHEISKLGVPATTLPNAEAIKTHLLSKIGKNDVILVMSNGAFGGLIQLLMQNL